MSTTSGTQNTEQNLNEVPKTEEGLFNAISAAMASGDEDEIARLMGATAPSTAADEVPVAETQEKTNETEVSGQVPPEKPDSTTTTEATPQYVEQLKAEINALKSNVGRIGSAQSQLAKLQKVVDEQAALLAAMQKTPSKLEERLNSLKDIDPEMAETLAALKDELAPAVKHTEAAEPEEEVRVMSELDRVRRVHPDVDHILVGGAARGEWDNWKASLTPEQRMYAESPHAEELILAFGAFKAAVQASRNKAPVNPAANATQEVNTTQNEDNAALVEERRRKLQASTTTKNQPLKTTGNDTIVDPDAMVAKYMKEIQQRDNLIR